MKRIVLLLMIFLLSTHIALAQNFCQGDFNYDGNVDAADVSVFLQNFGRSKFNNPCPADGPAPVPKTWQWISYGSGDDGEYEHGAMWPYPRFTDNSDGTITDNLTGLMWLKNANCIATSYPGFDNDGDPGDGGVTWQHALDFVAGINDGSYTFCGGNPPYLDWRLPNIKELQSLIHYGFSDPALPCTEGPCQWEAGDPFINLYFFYYWTSTTGASNTDIAWGVTFGSGDTGRYTKTSNVVTVWPVRGGH